MKPISLTVKKVLKFVLKLFVSGVAITFIISKIDVNQVWNEICTANIWFLVGALVIYVASQMLSAIRLNFMFAAMPLPLGTAMNMRLYWLGMFYNFFLPGGIGGDGYKVYYLNKHYRQHVKDLIATVLGDRLSGMTAIVIYLLLFSSFFVEKLPIPMREYTFLLIPLVVGAYYLFLRIVKRGLCQAFTKVVSMSFLIQGMQMCAATFVLYSLSGTTADMESYMFLFFVSTIASAIPIALPGGLGVREAVFFFGSQTLGTDETVAISLSLLFYVVSLISSVPGIVYMLRPSLIEGKKEHKGTPFYQT
ncbi:MAG: flippase-like domain-containing protein [Bacteroidales bacterium]|nr:flippase-like domain-containing protein [Bacteroidales bacterium]